MRNDVKRSEQSERSPALAGEWSNAAIICIAALLVSAQAQALTISNQKGTAAAPLVFDGKGQTISGLGYGIRCDNVENVIIRNYVITNCYDTGIAGDFTKNLTVENCIIHDCHYGLFFEENRGLKLINNDVYNIDVDGICLQNSNSAYPSDAQLIGNKVHDAIFAGGNHEDAMQLWGSFDGLVLRNNCIGDFTQLAYICTPAEDGIVKNVLIEGNVFYNDKYKSQYNGDTQGVFIGNHSGGVSNITIRNNTFGFLGYQAIWIFDNNINGVQISNNGYYGGGSIADVTSGAQNVVITGNFSQSIARPPCPSITEPNIPPPPEPNIPPPEPNIPPPAPNCPECPELPLWIPDVCEVNTPYNSTRIIWQDPNWKLYHKSGKVFNRGLHIVKLDINDVNRGTKKQIEIELRVK